MCYIDIKKLQINDNILLETVDFVYSITILDPVDKSVLIEGGKMFIRKHKAKIHGSYEESKMKSGHIIFGEKLELSYKNDNIHNTGCLSAAVSAKITRKDSGGDILFSYEVWE